MAIERITTDEPTLNLADISSYPTESGTPITSLADETIISCTVTAEGIGDDAIWGTSDDIEISPHHTRSHSKSNRNGTNPPEFVPDSLSVTLRPDGTATASIETGDLTGTNVEWSVVIDSGETETGRIQEGSTRPEEW